MSDLTVEELKRVFEDRSVLQMDVPLYDLGHYPDFHILAWNALKLKLKPEDIGATGDGDYPLAYVAYMPKYIVWKSDGTSEDVAHLRFDIKIFTERDPDDLLEVIGGRWETVDY